MSKNLKILFFIAQFNLLFCRSSGFYKKDEKLIYYLDEKERLKIRMSHDILLPLIEISSTWPYVNLDKYFLLWKKLKKDIYFFKNTIFFSKVKKNNKLEFFNLNSEKNNKIISIILLFASLIALIFLFKYIFINIYTFFNIIYKLIIYDYNENNKKVS